MKKQARPGTVKCPQDHMVNSKGGSVDLESECNLLYATIERLHQSGSVPSAFEAQVLETMTSVVKLLDTLMPQS